MSAHKDRVAMTERVQERRRARAEKGAGDVPVEPRKEKQMADRRAVASEDLKQHDENRMRDFHIGKRLRMKNDLTKCGRPWSIERRHRGTHQPHNTDRITRFSTKGNR